MQSTTARVGLLAAVVAVAVVLFIVLSGDDNGANNSGSTATSTGTETSAGGSRPSIAEVLTVRNGAPVGGIKELTFNKGDQVNIEVRLDQPAEEVHVHGYEITKPAQKSPVRISFPADIDGVFEVEVHEEGGGEFEIAELKVNP